MGRRAPSQPIHKYEVSSRNAVPTLCLTEVRRPAKPKLAVWCFGACARLATRILSPQIPDKVLFQERPSMARVTVEDCIDKVPNRFDLVLLASHRARMISSGTPITIERDNDKNPVVALREIADTTVSTDDLKEELVHSLQKYVEVDEPEPASVPLIGAPGATVDADDTEVTVERMTEEELLKGLEGLTPPEEQPEEEE